MSLELFVDVVLLFVCYLLPMLLKSRLVSVAMSLHMLDAAVSGIFRWLSAYSILYDP